MGLFKIMGLLGKKADPFDGLMVKVCAGRFSQDTSWKGCGYYTTEYPGGDRRRKPQEVWHSGYTHTQSRRVTISKEYSICKYPVTQGQWKAVMGEGFNPSEFRGDDNLPVEMVSWDDAQEFIKRLNELTGKKYRLPTEAEWQWAAMGASKDDDQGIYAGCNSETYLEDYAWYSANSDKKTHPVGKKKPNELGLYDMCGNVREWCSDWYQEDLGTSEVTDPQGPASGSSRVLRGGCWDHDAERCRVSYRSSLTPGYRNNSGFRLAL